MFTPLQKRQRYFVPRCVAVSALIGVLFGLVIFLEYRYDYHPKLKELNDLSLGECIMVKVLVAKCNYVSCGGSEEAVVCSDEEETCYKSEWILRVPLNATSTMSISFKRTTFTAPPHAIGAFVSCYYDAHDPVTTLQFNIAESYAKVIGIFVVVCVLSFCVSIVAWTKSIQLLLFLSGSFVLPQISAAHNNTITLSASV